MKYNYHLVIRSLAITIEKNLSFHKSKTNFLLVFLFTLLGFTNIYGQSPFTDNTPGGSESFIVPAGVTSITVLDMQIKSGV